MSQSTRLTYRQTSIARCDLTKLDAHKKMTAALTGKQYSENRNAAEEEGDLKHVELRSKERYMDGEL